MYQQGEFLPAVCPLGGEGMGGGDGTKLEYVADLRALWYVFLVHLTQFLVSDTSPFHSTSTN